ncbi:hypothetical protein D9757_001194 [Collybiopsis confluens]|uniref:tRNA (guanine(9)-N1)-methyltransferase n=1 Tax=Collybiopsis confluens TaxID=2823264 RepID=A0A8H5MGG4_9AGAR|nr:hypothetical protein D9757_001194 [Collybiopsis confluens]
MADLEDLDFADEADPPADHSATVVETSQPKMSKKAMKKAAKAERYQALKLERRAREKQMNKEKKKLRAQKRAAGEIDSADEQPKKKQKVIEFGGKVVLDLGFDKLMSEKEINSLTSQLAYTYSANRNSAYPFDLLCTSVDGRTRERLEAIGDAAYMRWSHTEWWQDGYEGLWSEGGASPPTAQGTADHAAKQSVVYLTADSGEEIEELKPDEIYIIGALVDHNRYKNLTLEKANSQSIRHARLPIGKYISSLPTRKVLTVNQVFEIMLKWVETKNWEEAFNCIIPKRKFLEGGKKNKGSKDISAEVQEDDSATVGDVVLLEQEDVQVEVSTAERFLPCGYRTAYFIKTPAKLMRLLNFSMFSLRRLTTTTTGVSKQFTSSRYLSTAIVTGSGRGIGRAIALRLAHDGFDICVNDLEKNSEDVNSVVEEIRSLGRSAISFCGDVRSMHSVKEMIAASVSGLGPLNVMVANAGVAQVSWPTEVIEEDMRRIFEVNVYGVVNSDIAAAQQFIKQGTKGKILNAASGVSFRVDAMLPIYSASKAAVRSLTQAFAVELGRHGITVNGYAPGIVDSAMWEQIDEELSKVNGLPKGENFKSTTKQIALGRTSVPEDAAKLVSYLAGPDSDYITGQTILVDGGLVFS